MHLKQGMCCTSMCSETRLGWILSSIRNGSVISNTKVCSHYNGNKFIAKTAHQFQLNFNKKSFACEVLSSQSRICQYKPSARKYGDLEEALEKLPL